MNKTGFLIIFIFLFFFANHAFAATWNYPLTHTLERPEYKKFGEYIDNNFYVGRQNLFPNKFIGFHAAADLEIFPNETNKKVPVYAITSGTISYIGPVSGYGGVILERLDGSNLTAIYGHLSLTDSNLAVGNKVNTGQTIADLGTEFSTETGDERKHLHFGIYKGTDLYFKGYEATESDLNSRWINPIDFLKKNGAVDPTQLSPTPQITVKIIQPNQPTRQNPFSQFFKWLVEFFKSI